LWLAESRPWLRWLGVIAVVSVVFQGVLGGLRVVMFKDEIGIFHATLAQLFFVLICSIALFTSKWGTAGNANSLLSAARSQAETSSPVRRLFLATTILIFLQLVIAATMRHQHAGLAIPDFPLAYGKLWPATDAESVAAYNQRRIEVTAAHPITAAQIHLQMTHRIVAVLILVGVAVCAWKARVSPSLRWLAFFWLGLIFIQVALGAWTIWSNKAADVATAHVVVGALSLVTGALGCIISFRRLTRSEPVPAAEISETAAARPVSA